MTLLPLISWLLYIATCVGYNWYVIEKRKKRPNYPAAKRWRVFWGLVFLIWMNPSFDPANHFFYQILKVFPSAVFIISSWYLFFDLGLNKARGLDWNYRGKDSGTLDASQLWVYYGLKILCAIALPISIIILMR